MIFLSAFLMAHERTMIIGYLSGLLFASVGLFQNRMAYDPVGLLNTSIAAVGAALVALAMWAIVAPETAESARGRFIRVAQKLMNRITASRRPIGLAEFATSMTEALEQWRPHLRPDQAADVAAFDAGTALLAAGRFRLKRSCSSQP